MQLLSKSIPETKRMMFAQQNGKCLLCENELDPNIESNHLDHDHSLDGNNAGRIRGLLCCRCNPLEGHLKHKFNSSGLVKFDVDYIKWLENLLDYLKRDYSSNQYHPNHISDTSKRFTKLNLNDMILQLNKYNFDYKADGVKSKKADLIRYFKKKFREYQKSL